MKNPTRSIHSGAPRGTRGGSLLIVVVMAAALSAMAVALSTVSNRSVSETRAVRENINARYVSEAGLAQAIAQLNSGGEGVVGSSKEPVTFGDSNFFVEAGNTVDGHIALTSTGAIGTSRARTQVVVQEIITSFWTYGAFGDVEMTMNANAMVDSYDSSAGTYASQEVVSGPSGYALSSGDIGSNGSITVDDNTIVHGDAVPGPTGTVTIKKSAQITGLTNPASEPKELPPLVIPTIPNSGPLEVAGGDTHVLSSGSYNFDSLLLNATSELVVHGPATLVFGSAELESQTSIIVDAQNGPVEIFVEGDFIMNSNTLIASTTYSPLDIQLYLNSDNVIDPGVDVDLDVVDFDSNAQFFGTIYAPNANIVINSNFELFGAVVAYDLHLDSNSEVHFDEALASSTHMAEIEFGVLCWLLAPIDEEP
jgi:hypothetical protein